MDSVIGEDQTLPFDINGSCSMSRLPDSIDVEEFSVDNMTAPTFPDKMSPVKTALTLKDYENQIMTLKKENFNLKLRIYFMEERMQQKCDDSMEDVYKTNIELKVEVESMKRDLAEQQELLVSASKALESLAGRESGDMVRARERSQRELDLIRDTLNRRIAELEQDLKAAGDEVEKMAAIAEHDKVRCISMEKQLLALGLSGTVTPVFSHDLQEALQEKNSVIEQLRMSMKSQEAVIQQLQRTAKAQGPIAPCADQGPNAPCADQVRQLSALIGQRDQELQTLRAELDRANERTEEDQQGFTAQKDEVRRLEEAQRQLSEELNQFRDTNQLLSKSLEDARTNNKALSGQLEESECQLTSEKKNALKRDKTIQGLTLVLKEKEKEIEELCHEIEDRDEALAKAREAAHKAQLQKYQGAEEHQNLLMEVQAELAQLQGEHHTKLLEAQKQQRTLGRREQELEELQQAKEQLDQELEEVQQQKKKGDKALNEVQNQLKKLSGELGERESGLKQQYQELLEQSRRRLEGHEVTIQRLSTCLADKEQQLQDYMNMMRDMEQSRSPGETGTMLSKLRERLKQKENALEEALDDKFVALEEKDNEIHLLNLSLREKERDLERLNNLLGHNEETINSFDSLIKEKDVELQHLVDTLKNLQRAKQDVEDNLNRACREKDSIISHLQRSLEGKAEDIEEMANALLSQSQSQASDLVEQMGQRLKVTEAMLAEAVKARERLVGDNKCAVEELLATVNSKDQLLKESSERYNHTLSVRVQEIQELKRQMFTQQQELVSAEKRRSTATQEGLLEMAKLQSLLTEKDSIINKLLERGAERDQFLAELKLNGPGPPQELKLRQTIQVLQERLEEKEGNVVLEQPFREACCIAGISDETQWRGYASWHGCPCLPSGAPSPAITGIALCSSNASHCSSSAWYTCTHELLPHVAGESQQERPGNCRCGSNVQRLGAAERGATHCGTWSHFMLSLTSRALRAEQQLYSSLVRTIKEQDSAQRIHGLQMELTVIALLRQQLEEGVKSNDELRDQLDREISRAKLAGEGCEVQAHVDPVELQSIRHQLEDAHRWNASLQARLGAIQNRRGGVGANNDTADTLGSFLADQTSYMSICVGDGVGLEHLSVEELRQKVMELQDYIRRLEAVNGEVQSGLLLAEGSDLDLSYTSSGKERRPQRPGHGVSGRVQESQMDSGLGQVVDGILTDHHRLGDADVSELPAQIQASAENQRQQQEVLERDRKWEQLRCLLSECGVLSVTHLREELERLRSENANLRGQLKEEKSSEPKESADTSGDSGDAHADLHKTTERLKSETKGHRKVVKPLKERWETTVAGVPEKVKPSLAQAGALGGGKVPGGEETGQLGRDDCATQGSSLAKSANLFTGNGVVKSRLPVPVRLNPRRESGHQAASAYSEHLREDVLQQLDLDNHSDQQAYLDSATCGFPIDSHSGPGSDHSSSTTTTEPTTQGPEGLEMEFLRSQTPTDAELLSQLELLHQECQDKEQLIGRLEEQMTGWDAMQTQLRQKDLLNRQYVEALQAAESTIAYLTACNLDSQDGVPDPAGPDFNLHKALDGKERLDNQLVDCLSMVEKTIASLGFPSSHYGPPDAYSADPRELCMRLEAALQQINASNGSLDLKPLAPGPSDGSLGPDAEQKSQVALQEVLHEQSRANAEPQERLKAAEEAVAAQRGTTNTAPAGLEENYSRQQDGDQKVLQSGKKSGSIQRMVSNEKGSLESEQIAYCFSECLSAAESAIASLTDHCTNTSTSASGVTRATRANSDLKRQLGRLKEALREREQLAELASVGHTLEQTDRSPTKHTTPGVDTRTSSPLELHHNICLLQKAFSDLQEEVRRTREDHPLETGARAQSLEFQAQLESLQKALNEKRTVCKSLEAKLATAQSILAQQNKMSSDGAAQRAPPEHDDKGVQVDLQDLGYETSGKSEPEVDREEGRSTDVQLVTSSSLPSLLKRDLDEPSFSSTENLDMSSSASYPSSPALSSPKVCVKSLRTFDSYGLSEDPVQLRAQVGELKTHLESHHRVVLHLQTLLQRRASMSSELLTATPDSHVATGGPTDSERPADGGKEEERRQEVEEGLKEGLKEKMNRMNEELERQRSVNRSMSEQLKQAEQRSRSVSPARIDSLVQSQARELSQLRRQIQESRGLGALQRRQLEELSRAFEELMQASDVDYYMGEVFREQLDKSLSVLERLEDQLEKGDTHLDVEDGAALELAQRLSKALQEKSLLVHSLQSQLRGRTPSSHQSSDSEVSDTVSNRATVSCHNSPRRMNGDQGNYVMKEPAGCSVSAPESLASRTGGVAEDGGVSGRKESARRLQELQRENRRLAQQLRSSEEMNDTLRSELELNRSFLVQGGSMPLHTQDEGHRLGQSSGMAGGSSQSRVEQSGRAQLCQQQDTAQLHGINPDVLAEHLLEIRALRQRLEETIHTNNQLREQLERKLAEVERDPAATNIFIHGSEEQGQLTSELRHLWGQNQVLKEQLNLGSRDKQKENEKLREALARRTAKLEKSRKECEALRQERTLLQERLDRSTQEHDQLQERLDRSTQEHDQLQDRLRVSRDEIHRLQCEVKVLRQQLSDSQHLLQSLRVELQVYEQMKTSAGTHTHTEKSGTAQQSCPGMGSGSNQVDLGELLSEIRHLRLQLERSIQTNTALRQRLEEQLLRGPNRPDTININYLLSTSEEGGKSPGREGLNTQHQHSTHSDTRLDMKHQAQPEMDVVSQCSNSSVDSVSGSAPPLSRLVPGHRLWVNPQGRHVLGLIEDHNALRKQISEGRRLLRSMDTHLQDWVHAVSQRGPDNQVLEQGHLKRLTGSMNTIQQVLEEAGRLLKLVWRVSLPPGTASSGADASGDHQDELLKNELARLKSRLSQQEKLLTGAVRRLRTTNQLKEGMERVIMDQLSLTHGVLKKARGNLEEIPINGQ
ncbi:hypothetical protein DPEC_G00321470 [Dallia pectoralis]|uniref:Uncharacterized protein n=1 Tax=Dallia pectoralis TaxID=75939 RepID=A0ACC2FA92_DALPE|nr:hypothetical protein DPEC_G00321470 [Dallia pectoralis]